MHRHDGFDWPDEETCPICLSDDQSREIARLREAIQEHRTETLTWIDNPSPADEKLWALVALGELEQAREVE